MNDSKHTQGPWGHHPGTRYCISQQPSETISNVPHAECINLDSRSKEENEANAKLIAAAPELLEALTELLLFVKPKPYGFNISLGVETLERIRTLIAKATE